MKTITNKFGFKSGRNAFAIFGAAGIALAAFAQPASAISLTGTTYSENFDSMTATGTAAPAGWTVGTVTGNATVTGAPTAPTTTGAVTATNTVTPGTGSGTAGGFYNFGVAGTNVVGERALGSLASSGLQRNTFLTLTNNTGAAITSFTIKYDGEQWRNGGNNVATVLTMQYSTDGTTWTNMGTGFNFTTPIVSTTAGALDGNAPANRTANITGTYTPAASIADAATFYVRFVDPDDTGADAALAVDNFSLTVVPEPTTIMGGALLLGAAAWGLRRRARAAVAGC